MYDVLVRVCIVVLQGGEATASALQDVGVSRGAQACRQQLLSLTAGVQLTPEDEKLDYWSFYGTMGDIKENERGGETPSHSPWCMCPAHSCTWDKSVEIKEKMKEGATSLNLTFRL